MDLYKAIKDLLDEKNRLDQVIHSLELLQLSEVRSDKMPGGSPYPRSNRGRKHMDEGERVVVSERMRRYWASRRAAKAAAQAAADQTIEEQPDEEQPDEG